MNKKIRLIVGWTIIAILIQNAIFLYIDKIYLTSDLKLKVGNINKKKVEDDKEIKVDIDSSAENIAASYDGKYVSYKLDNKLKIKSLNDNKDTTIDLDELIKDDTKRTVKNREIVYYNWFESDDSMIIMQKLVQNGRSYFEPIAYNAKKNEVRELSDFNMKKLQIPVNSKEDTVGDIAFSNLTHSIYIKIDKSKSRSDIYYANVMNQLKKVKNNSQVSDMAVTTTNTNLITEEGNKIRVLNRKNEIKIQNEKTLKILGTDSNDNLFIGAGSDTKINKVFFGEINDNKNDFKTLNLPVAVNKKDIFIDNQGKVFINNKDKSEIIDISNGNKSYKYSGDVIAVYNKGLILKSNNSIVRTKF
ncbi:hypothetical protein SAMN02745163_03183 [Clostridium cavendishii DSM 21758]|uniref:Uncharacterized protein n=1 Tax=Clostridium cavendishii DSM 21758 TaxID=1121302 RepID=A0A1M6PKB1_9CLOT|nr:hypothetical protein [Clostridium cavendishii]SHK08412.1 hypothetical protein SAMN02745163_03183 [Clostridium cavendishii DSM 21758]